LFQKIKNELQAYVLQIRTNAPTLSIPYATPMPNASTPWVDTSAGVTAATWMSVAFAKVLMAEWLQNCIFLQTCAVSCWN